MVVHSIIHDISERKKLEREKELLISKLETSLSEIKTLQGILPICAYCKKIRNDSGYWDLVEAYITQHTEAKFSHGICPECLELEYKKIDWEPDD